jgi:hypothetical protein
MFKWVCLAVATAGLAIFLWMVNDVRLQVQQITSNINNQLPRLDKDLPRIMNSTEEAVQTVNKHLPEIIRQTQQSVQTLGEVARDVKHLKDVISKALANKQNQELLGYALSVLDLVESQDATIHLGTKDARSGSGSRAKKWARTARNEAPLLGLIGKSRGDVLTRLCTGHSGLPWYIRFAEKEPMRLLDWVKANHGPSKGL